MGRGGCRRRRGDDPDFGCELLSRGSGAGVMRGGGHHGRLPCAAPAGGGRLPGRRYDRRALHARNTRRREPYPRRLRVGRDPADVHARAGVQHPPPAAPGSARRLYHGRAGRPDALARLRLRAGAGMERAREHFHRRAALDLFHHDRGQGVRRAAGRRRSARSRLGRAAVRGPGRGDHAGGADAARRRRGAERRGARMDRLASGDLSAA